MARMAHPERRRVRMSRHERRRRMGLVAGFVAIALATTALVGFGLGSPPSADSAGPRRDVLVERSPVREDARLEAPLQRASAGTRERVEGAREAPTAPPDGKPVDRTLADGRSLLLAGRVVTQEGDPVPDAQLLIRTSINGGPETRYVGDHQIAATTDADGRFEVHAWDVPDDGVVEALVLVGWIRSTDASARAQHSHTPPKVLGPVGFPAGTQDAEVVVGGGPEITLRVLVDDWVKSRGAVQIQIRGPSSGIVDRCSMRELESSGPKVRITGFQRGPHVVEAVTSAGGRPLLRREISLDEGLHDLGTIDLRGAVALCSIRLIDAQGAEVEGGVVKISDATGELVSDAVHCSTRGSLVVPVPTRLGLLEIEHESAGRTVVSPAMFRHVAEDPIRRRVEVVLGQ